MKLVPACASVISGELVAILKGLGIIRSSAFIDDITILADTFTEWKQQLDLALVTIWSIIFEVQVKKILQPSQQQIYLGYTLDSVAQTVPVSKPKQTDRMLRLISLADSDFILSCSQIASLCGTHTSHFASVMPGARSYLRRLWRLLAIMPRRGLHGISAEDLSDLGWWIDCIFDPSWSGTRMWLTEADFVVLSMKSDASGDDGYGYHAGVF